MVKISQSQRTSNKIRKIFVLIFIKSAKNQQENLRQGKNRKRKYLLTMNKDYVEAYKMDLT